MREHVAKHQSDLERQRDPWGDFEAAHWVKPEYWQVRRRLGGDAVQVERTLRYDAWTVYLSWKTFSCPSEMTSAVFCTL